MENKAVTIEYKTLIIVALGLVIVYLLLNKCSPAPALQTSSVTETTVDIKKTIDEAVNNAMAKQIPDTRPYIVYPDNRISPVNNIKDLNSADLSMVKTLKVYKDTTRLKNATVYSEIVADGKVYSNTVKAEVDEKTITKTVTVTNMVTASGLFVTGGAGADTGFKVDNINAGLMYISRNNVGIGAELQYNFQIQQPVVNVKFAKRIF